MIHTENDWYSSTEGQGEITYPAPFDQPFYIILNLAVGRQMAGQPRRDHRHRKRRLFYRLRPRLPEGPLRRGRP